MVNLAEPLMQYQMEGLKGPTAQIGKPSLAAEVPTQRSTRESRQVFGCK